MPSLAGQPGTAHGSRGEGFLSPRRLSLPGFNTFPRRPRRPDAAHASSNFSLSAVRMNIENILKKPLSTGPIAEHVQEVADESSAIISSLLAQVEDMWHQYASVRKQNLKLREELDSLQSDLHRTMRALQQERHDKKVIQELLSSRSVL